MESLYNLSYVQLIYKRKWSVSYISEDVYQYCCCRTLHNVSECSSILDHFQSVVLLPSHIDDLYFI